MPMTKSLKNTVLFLAVSTLPLMLAGCDVDVQQQGGGFPPPQVSVAEVSVRNVTPWIETSGHIAAKENVQIRPRVGGVIEEVPYREGAIVKKGDLLFVIDQQPFRAELNRTEAGLTRARAEADLARAEIKRARNLVERKLLSPGEYDQRVAAEANANANVLSAEAELQLARLNMKYTEVRSPIDGRAGLAFTTKGNLVSSDTTADLLTTVVSLDPMYVYFGSDELTYLQYSSQARQITANGNQQNTQRVFIGLSNEEGFPREGYVDFVDNQLDPNTGSIRIRAVLDNKDHTLTPGLFARVRILAPENIQAMLIDDQAILTDQDRKFVYVLGPENKAMRRNIKIGQIIEGLRMVTEGLQPDDQVIVYGIQKIFFPGMPVSPQKIRMGDPPPGSGPITANEH